MSFSELTDKSRETESKQVTGHNTKKKKKKLIRAPLKSLSCHLKCDLEMYAHKHNLQLN